MCIGFKSEEGAWKKYTSEITTKPSLALWLLEDDAKHCVSSFYKQHLQQKIINIIEKKGFWGGLSWKELFDLEFSLAREKPEIGLITFGAADWWDVSFIPRNYPFLTKDRGFKAVINISI